MSNTLTALCYTDDDCQNGGSCRLFDDTANDFLQPSPSGNTKPGSCKCRSGYKGPSCQEVDNYVCTTDGDCLNRGSCLTLAKRIRNENRHDFLQTQVATYCDCPRGYTGAKCEVRDYTIDIVGGGGPTKHDVAEAEESNMAIILGFVLGAFAVVWILIKLHSNVVVGGSSNPATGIPQEKDGIAVNRSKGGLRQRKQPRGSSNTSPVGPVKHFENCGSTPELI